MTYGIIWKGEARPDLEQMLRADLKDVYEELNGEMGKLIFHTTIVTDDIDGPTITSWGDQQNNIVAEYNTEAMWETAFTPSTDKEK